MPRDSGAYVIPEGTLSLAGEGFNNVKYEARLGGIEEDLNRYSLTDGGVLTVSGLVSSGSISASGGLSGATLSTTGTATVGGNLNLTGNLIGSANIGGATAAFTGQAQADIVTALSSFATNRSITVANNAVGSINLGVSVFRGFAVVVSASSTTLLAVYYIRAASTNPFASLVTSNLPVWDGAAGALNGAAGTPGNVTVSCSGAGVIEIRNKRNIGDVLFDIHVFKNP